MPNETRNAALKAADSEDAYIAGLDEYRFLLDFLVSQEVPVISASDSLRIFSLRVDKFYWRAGDIYVFRDRPNGKVSCNQISHHAIHHLLVKAFGAELRGRPLFTLYSEAIASCSDFYFYLRSLSAGCASGRSAEDMLNGFRTANRHLNSHAQDPEALLLEKIKLNVRDPFDAFREATDEMFDSYMMFWKIMKKRRQGKAADFLKIFSRIQEYAYGCFFFGYDFSGNIYYTMNYCGIKSSDEDLRLVEETRKMLWASATFEEFLEKLSAVIPQETEKAA